jgi:transcriptional antiterminator NusG
MVFFQWSGKEAKREMASGIADHDDEPVDQSSMGASVQTGDGIDAGGSGEEAAPEEKLNAFGFRDDEMVTDEDDLDDEPVSSRGSPIEEFVEEPTVVSVDEGGMDWYILKVQVNRENSICDALKRRVRIAGMDAFFGDVLVPTEDVREYTKAGKQ